MQERKHPYQGLPDYQFWKSEVAIEDGSLFDPVHQVSFVIEPDVPVMTAGSCFAQHVARHLSGSGFNFLVTEAAHPIIPTELAREYGYGLYTARYGNIYTARQLKQLLQRSYGQLQPIETAWRNTRGQVVDPFRPQIQKDGFISETELLRDRDTNFTAVREAIEKLGVLVFTLGLTETWVDKRDDTVFPIAPGVFGGVYQEEVFSFRNFSVAEVIEDLQWCIDFIRARNSSANFIFTVSPVALNATAENKHVFVATTASKAVLRAAAEVVCSGNRACDYFPSYEIITSPYVRGRYFAPDCRSVTEAGVEHVMRVFFRHYGNIGKSMAGKRSKQVDKVDLHTHDMQKIIDVLCDEEAISNI